MFALVWTNKVREVSFLSWIIPTPFLPSINNLAQKCLIFQKTILDTLGVIKFWKGAFNHVQDRKVSFTFIDKQNKKTGCCTENENWKNKTWDLKIQKSLNWLWNFSISTSCMHTFTCSHKLVCQFLSFGSKVFINPLNRVSAPSFAGSIEWAFTLWPTTNCEYFCQILS